MYELKASLQLTGVYVCFVCKLKLFVCVWGAYVLLVHLHFRVCLCVRTFLPPGVYELTASLQLTGVYLCFVCLCWLFVCMWCVWEVHVCLHLCLCVT